MYINYPVFQPEVYHHQGTESAAPFAGALQRVGPLYGPLAPRSERWPRVSSGHTAIHCDQQTQVEALSLLASAYKFRSLKNSVNSILFPHPLSRCCSISVAATPCECSRVSALFGGLPQDNRHSDLPVCGPQANALASPVAGQTCQNMPWMLSV